MQRTDKGEGGKASRNFWKLLIFFVLVGLILFWFEWLGSEQQMDIVEQPVPLPAKIEG